MASYINVDIPYVARYNKGEYDIPSQQAELEYDEKTDRLKWNGYNVPIDVRNKLDSKYPQWKEHVLKHKSIVCHSSNTGQTSSYILRN
jgi:hypothetical protein